MRREQLPNVCSLRSVNRSIASPTNALAHRRIAILASVTGDGPAAVAAYREAARIDPKDANSRGRLARLLYARDDLTGAIAAFRDAIRIDPMRTSDHYALAAALAGIGDQEGEIAELREAIRVNRLPRDPAPEVAAQESDDLSNDSWIDTIHVAVLDMKVFLSFRDGYSYGSALRFVGDLTGAIAALRDTIKLNPGSEIEARYSLAMAWPSRAMCQA